nr:ras-related protein Rab-35 isoform X1 [Saimiri boliviensis boliviensis]
MLLMPPSPLQRLHCGPSPSPRSAGVPRGTVSVLCRYLKNSLHVFVSGGAIGTSSPSPLECQEGVGPARPPLPVPPSPRPRRLDLARTLPAEQTDSQSLYIVYIALPGHIPCPALAFASLMPACCNGPSLRPSPAHLTTSSVLRRQRHVLAASLASLRQWSGLRVAHSLRQAVSFCPWHAGSCPLSGACASSLPSLFSCPHSHSESWGTQPQGPAVPEVVSLAPWPTDFLSCLLDASELQTQGSHGFSFLPRGFGSIRKVGVGSCRDGAGMGAAEAVF